MEEVYKALSTADQGVVGLFIVSSGSARWSEGILTNGKEQTASQIISHAPECCLASWSVL